MSSWRWSVLAAEAKKYYYYYYHYYTFLTHKHKAAGSQEIKKICTLCGMAGRLSENF